MALRQQVGEEPSSQGRDGAPVEGAVEQQVPQLLRHQSKHLTLHSHPSTIAVIIGPHTFYQVAGKGSSWIECSSGIKSQALQPTNLFAI